MMCGRNIREDELLSLVQSHMCGYWIITYIFLTELEEMPERRCTRILECGNTV